MVNIDRLDNKLNKKAHIKKLAEDINNVDINFEYTSDFRNAKELRDFIEAISELVWVPSKWKNRLILIADEINNNAIEYGSLPEDMNRITVKMKKEGTKINVKFEVEDTWKWKEPKTAKEMYNLKENKLEKGFENHTGIRGRWLFLIIHKTVDNLYFEDSENGWLIVWIEKILDLSKKDL